MDDKILSNIKSTILKLDFVPFEQRESLVAKLPFLYTLPEGKVNRFMRLLELLVCRYADKVTDELDVMKATREVQTADVLTNLLNETITPEEGDKKNGH